MIQRTPLVCTTSRSDGIQAAGGGTTAKAGPNIVPAAGRAPALAAHGITMSYGSVEALRGVDLEIHSGEVHALVGDNGAGKSTLLKVMAGAILPTGGQLSMDGQPIHLQSPIDAREMGIETVYQDLALAGDRSAAANVYLGREVMRPGLLGKLGVLDRKAMAARVTAKFAELDVPITDVSRRVNELSGGQRQGVAIARAAIWATKVVLLDEPTAALGVRQRSAVESLIRKLRERGLAVVLVSHQIPEVLSISDRVTVLRLGQNAGTRSTGEVDVSWIVATIVG